jgi:hypothetical protein
MRCEDIQERFIDLLYDERGTPPASPELRGHLASCPSCRQQLEELRATRTALAGWKDEAPLRPVLIPRLTRSTKTSWRVAFNFARFAATAAVIILAFLALANADITWNRDGFSFRTHLLAKPQSTPDFYTKAEVRNLLKSVVDDTEGRVMETNYLMIQRMMDTIEADRHLDLSFVRAGSARNHNKN